MGKPVNTQRLVIYETPDGQKTPYSSVYGDEDYANRLVERCKDRHPECEVYILNSDAMPLK